jgi:hypothetical protein
MPADEMTFSNIPWSRLRYSYVHVCVKAEDIENLHLRHCRTMTSSYFSVISNYLFLYLILYYMTVNFKNTMMLKIEITR